MADGVGMGPREDLLGMGWAGQIRGLLEKRKAEDGKCLLLISIWRDSEPLAICQAALLSIYQCKLPT